MSPHLLAQEGPHQGLILLLNDAEEWILGRDPDEANLLIQDTTVSRKHAHLMKTPDGIVIENLSKVNPLLINGKEIPYPHLLKEGDNIQVGNTVLRFSEEDTESKELLDREVEEASSFQPKKRSYDTIFEDLQEDDEAPFHLLSEAPFLLKVISGPNAGAEIGLEKGRSYTIGKEGSSSDITFQDMSVSRNHARLSVSEEGIIQLEDLGSKNGTSLNGLLVTTPKEVAAQDLISVGTTSFLIIDREAPQETIYSPMLSPYEAPKTAEPKVEEPLLPKTDWKTEKIPFRHLVVGGAFVLVGFFLLISLFSLFKPERHDVVNKDPSHQIEQALAKFQDVQFSFNPASSKLFLVGHVKNGVDYQELLFRIQEIGFIQSLEDTVVIDDLVAKSMNDVLSERGTWKGVTIQVPQAGLFVATGYVSTNKDIASLNDYLMTSFPYLDKLTNRVASEESLKTQIQSFLNADGLNSVQFTLENGDVTFSGMYSETQITDYQNLLKKIGTLEGILLVKNFAIPTHPNLAAVNLSDQYQLGGISQLDGKGYSVIVNGKIYTLGDLFNGMKIITIQSNAILLEKDGIKYTINYIR